MNKTVVIDARMINMSGIGRYIQSLLPSLIKSFPKTIIMGNIEELGEFDWSEQVTLLAFTSPIYSIKEQLAYFNLVPKCDLFLSPHYNVPILLPQATATAAIIPDVNHLVFKKELSYLKNVYAKFFYKLATTKDLVFTISEFSKAEIVKFTGCTESKIQVAKCSIDKDHFSKIAAKVDVTAQSDSPGDVLNQDFILYVGNIKPHKNLKRSLLAFERAITKHKNLNFVIVGKKDNFLTKDNEVFDLVENNKLLKERVIFTGRIDDIELVRIYKRAKMLLFVSLYEGFGLPPLEAMFLGCPVIASREGSLPEICEDAVLYCDGYNVEDIGLKISELLESEELRASLISKGYKQVAKYDWQLFNDKIIGGISNYLK